MDMTDKTDEVIVVIESGSTARIKEIAEQLRTAGLNAICVMEKIGIVSGRVRRELIGTLREIEGVFSVDLSGEVRIAPPGSEVQ
jgi:hypothetical protein